MSEGAAQERRKERDARREQEKMKVELGWWLFCFRGYGLVGQPMLRKGKTSPTKQLNQ